MATRYWVGGAGNWSSTTKWSATSGGGSGASVPISTDDVFFDANSGLTGLIATVDTAQTCASLTLSPGSTAGLYTIVIASSLTVTGAFSMSGTAGNRRYLISSSTYGIATNFVVGSASGLSDVDFRDLLVTGAAAPLSGTRIGNLQGVTGVTFSAPKNVYRVGGGTLNWSALGWAPTSGGTADANSFPLAQDTAVFDSSSGATLTSTFNTAIPYTGSIDMSARTTAMTIAATAAFTIYGNWINSTSTVISGTGITTFANRTAQSITSATKAFTQPITIDSFGGTVSLTDALNIGTNTLTVTNGTFNTNGFTVTALTLSSSNSNVRAINLGASTINLSNTFNAVDFTTSTNLTFNAGTSSIVLSGGSTANIFSGGGNTFYNVTLTDTGNGGVPAISGTNTFNNFTMTAPAATGLISLRLSANQTVNGTLTVAGATAIRRMFLRSDTIGTQRTISVGTLSAQDCDFRDIAVTGAAAPYDASLLRVGDCGGNSGVTFAAGVPKYWNLGGTTVNWSATGWATSSGGTPAVNNFPLAQDTATFNTAGTVPSTNLVMDAAWNVGTFNASARTTAMPFSAGTAGISVYGNWLFGTGVTVASTTGTITFSGRGTQNITSNAITFNCPVTINSSTGTVQLVDGLTLSSARTLTITSGTFDAVTFPVSTGIATLSGGTQKMGSGTWTLSGTGVTVWTQNGGTFLKGTANIVLSDQTTGARTFAGGGQTYNTLTIGGATGVSTLTITGNNQFATLASTKTVAHTIALGTTTQTFGSWTVTGTVGNVVTVTGGATLTIVGSRVSGVDYLAMGTAINNSLSTGEFYAGANSTGTGNRIILTAAPTPVTRYWVGGTGTWDASTTTNWSASSGGAGGASVPTSADAVVFDTLSNATAYTVTCTATQLRCAALTMAGPLTGNVTWAGTAPLAIHGNVSLSATGITRTYTGTITLSGSTTGRTFTTNNVSLASPIDVNGVGCGWSLGSALTLGTTNNISLTNGSFDTANFNCFIGRFSTSSLVNNISLSLGSSIITEQSNGFACSGVNFTFNAGTSTINNSETSAASINGTQPLTFYNYNFTGANLIQATINGAHTFNNLSFAGRTAIGVTTILFASNLTITGTLTFSAGTNATMRLSAQSTTIATSRTLTCAAVSGTDVDFRDITIAGAAAPISGLRFGDCKGNSGITFDAGVPKYWNLAGGGNWSSVGWATSSGGTPAVNNFPLAQDTATFESTGLNSGATITVDAGFAIGTIDMSARSTNTIILATGSTTPFIYGNWINGTGTTPSGTGILTFTGRGSQTITSATRTFTQPITITTPGGSVILGDAFTTSASVAGALQITQGTFDANGYSVTFSGASSTVTTSGSVTRTIAVGSAIWTLAGSGNAWNIAASTGLTITGSGTIRLSNASAKTFVGGGVSYSNVALDQGGAGALTISGNNTLGNITNSYGTTGATSILLANTTQTVSQFTAAGTATRLLTISGTSAAAPGTLIYTGSGNVNVDYLTINNVRGYPL